MGERLLCKQEVVGSTPITSTRAGCWGLEGSSWVWPPCCGLFFAIVDRVNLDLAAASGVLPLGRVWRGPGLDERV